MVKFNQKHHSRGKEKTFLYKKVKNFNQTTNRYSETLDRVLSWPDWVPERPDWYSSKNGDPMAFNSKTSFTAMHGNYLLRHF
jgi:hypothetical protein